ncbi:MAG: archease [Candidatus Hydrogenedentes bacterium]|nr:archease [Candidatus Hydrogenedentota bacterium]
MPYQFLEHTADVRAECRAPTFEALLETAAQALYAVAFNRIHHQADLERRLQLTADSPEETLVRWLQDLIYLMDVEHFIATRFDIQATPTTTLHATLHGYHYTPEERATEIKAATYHGMKVSKTDAGYLAEVIFDL